MTPGATGWLAEPLDEQGSPKYAVLVLGDGGHDPDTGEALVAVAIERERWHSQLRTSSSKHFKARWLRSWRWDRVPSSALVVDNPEPSYTAVSQAAASLCAGLFLDHVAGAPWSPSDRLLLGAALSLSAGAQVGDEPSLEELRAGLDRAVGA